LLYKWPPPKRVQGLESELLEGRKKEEEERAGVKLSRRNMGRHARSSS
jgi:hypothetical protein